MIKILRVKLAPRELILMTLAFCLAAGLSIWSLNNSPEINASEKFDAGRIMDDEVMENYNSMSKSEIQRFLKSKNSCDDRDLSKVDKYKDRFKYNIKNGHFVCMADEDFDGESAAEIIYNAAKDYKINPQVLIVLLQKEQSLVTDTFPNHVQYRAATGYGCPDTADCSKEYYGFKNQVRNAAKLFRAVLDGKSRIFPIGRNQIQYNPDRACGRSTVNIKNLATSALYRYTPYQPNKAALEAGFGKGDSCSAYGNRNFYKYFTKWFGTTLAKTKPQQDNTLISYESAALKDGVYYFESSYYSGKVLDIAWASSENLANAQIWNLNHTKAQQFEVKYNSTGKYYTIRNVNSGKFLNLRKTEDGSNVHQYKRTTNCDEQWGVNKRNDGDYEIYSMCDKRLFLDIEKNSETMNVYASKSNQIKTKKWKITEVSKTNNKTSTDTSSPSITNNTLEDDNLVDSETIPDGEYVIVSALSNKMTIDVKGASLLSGELVHFWHNNGTDAQKFNIKYNYKNKAYNIFNKRSGMALDVYYAKTAEGTPVQQWKFNDTCAQNWKIVAVGNDYYKLVSNCSKKVLDVSAAKIFDGNKLQIWKYNGTKAQHWKFIKSN